MASSGGHRHALYRSLIHSSRPGGSALRLPAADYPVFAPSREGGEPLPRRCYVQPDSKIISEISQNLSEFSSMEEGKIIGLETSEDGRISMQPRKGSFLHENPAGQTNSEEFKTIICNEFKAIVSRDTHNNHGKSKNVNIVVAKNKSPFVSWFFHKVRKKTKSEASTNTTELKNMSRLLKDWGVFSHEALKKELTEANEEKDVALSEAAEMKSSFAELRARLISLESYCEELKNALNVSRFQRRPYVSNITTNSDASIPATNEVMVECFVKIVSEARISVKQFCKTLVDEIEESDDGLISKLNSIIKPHRFILGTKYSRGVLYHLEAFVNQCLFEDFENCVFLKNGSPKLLDPNQDRLQKFSSFISLRNLRWNEHHNEDFSGFCDRKMLSMVSLLNFSRPWPEKLLRSFYVSTNCIWLLHLLAFSFSPPLTMLRVDENRAFDSLYMEDILADNQRGQLEARVKIMVMPGFYVHDRVLRCKVLCRYRTGQ